MLKRTFWIAAMCLSSSAFAQTPGIAGKWFSDGGKLFMTIYQYGTDYSASLANTEGIIPAGSSHAVPGSYKTQLQNFQVNGNSVTFTTYEQDFTDQTNTRLAGTITQSYSLTLSPEGLRLIGTDQMSGMFGNKTWDAKFFKHD